MRLRLTASLVGNDDVSIHAPREGCDVSLISRPPLSYCFNSRTPGGVRHGYTSGQGQARPVSIHAPREGCDGSFPSQPEIPQKFQFTHPGRGATPPRSTPPKRRPSFNSRTPGGVRLVVASRWAVISIVSIHAPREGCDRDDFGNLQFVTHVSIHAPREGCDILYYNLG